jgi:hypothetical protein
LIDCSNSIQKQAKVSEEIMTFPLCTAAAGFSRCRVILIAPQNLMANQIIF